MLTILRKVSVSGGTVLRAANNLGDVASAATARTNLGVPSTAEVAAAAAPLINPRAPRQALAFDGTSGCGVANVAAFGTKDFTLSVWVLHKGVVGYIFGLDASGSGFELGLRANGNIFSAHSGIGFTDIATGLTANVFHHLCYSRTGGTGTFLVNGVSVGTQADSYDYTSSNAAFGKNHAGTFPFTGVLSQPLSYNRALSAAEVLALYEQGAPAAADYATGGVGVEAIATAVDSTFAPNSGNWGTWNNGTLTQPGGSGTKLVYSVGGYNPAFGLYINSNYLTVGKWYTLAITLADFVGGTTCVVEGSTTSLVAGANTLVFQATTTKPKILLSGTTTGFSIAPGISIKKAGLLCAPEANAPGNGYQWRDMSGNMADITVPVSGVAWALPDTRPNRVRGTLTWAGTHEAKFLFNGGGQELPANAVVQLITTKATVGSSGTGITIFTNNTGGKWVATNTFTTAKKVHTLAAQLPSGTAANDLHFLVDPDNANFTGSITVEAQFSITEGNP